MKNLFCFLLLFSSLNVATAQPSNAIVKKDAIGSGAGVIAFKFTKTTGTRQWNKTAGNWEYVRGVEVKRKSEYAGINLIVKGDVVYQYVGAGGYSYWKFRVLTNEYEGIPNPSSKEITDFINKDRSKFYGYYYDLITKLWIQPALDTDPQWTWHSPNSVEFRMKMKFDYIIRNTGIETLETIWNVRLYRNDPQSPWNNMLALKSEEADDNKVISLRKYSTQQLADFEKQTLAFTMAEQTAQENISNLSKIITVPDFKDADEMLRFLHNVLRNGNPDQLRAVMLQVLAPGFFTEGSRIQLLPAEERNFADVVLAVYNNKVKYKQLYCQSPLYTVEKWGNSTTRKDITIKSAVDQCNTKFTIDRVNMGYVEGVPVTRLAILTYGIYVRQDQDVLNYINSFSDRRKICPND